MEVAAIAGIAVIAAVTAAMLRRYHQEYAAAIALAAGALILLQVMSAVLPVVSGITELLSASGLSGEYGVILLKALGICFLAQFSADACRDAGESALAAKVELAGKVAVAALALPLFENIASTALSLIGG